MKTKFILLATLVSSTLAHADISLPRGTLESGELAKATEIAKAEKKFIAYLYTEKNTTCPLCANASEEFIKLVRSKAVIVYLDSEKNKTYWASLPDSVRTELNKGKFIPKMVVTEADGSTVAAQIHYDDYKKDDRAATKELKKGLKEEK